MNELPTRANFRWVLDIAIENISPADREVLERGDLEDHVMIAKGPLGWFVFCYEPEPPDLVKILAPSVWAAVEVAREYCDWVYINDGGNCHPDLEVYEREEDGIPL